DDGGYERLKSLLRTGASAQVTRHLPSVVRSSGVSGTNAPRRHDERAHPPDQFRTFRQSFVPNSRSSPRVGRLKSSLRLVEVRLAQSGPMNESTPSGAGADCLDHTAAPAAIAALLAARQPALAAADGADGFARART